MIEKFCSRLPVEISKPMYNEYYSRLKEIKFIVAERPTYYLLREDIKTIELILALSIFYKRVISNIRGATFFAYRIFRHSDAQAIRIGNYDLTPQEQSRIDAVVMQFNILTQKYELSHDLITTVETKDLIRKIRALKVRFQAREDNQTEENEPF